MNKKKDLQIVYTKPDLEVYVHQTTDSNPRMHKIVNLIGFRGKLFVSVVEPTWLLIDRGLHFGSLLLDARLASEGAGQPVIQTEGVQCGRYYMLEQKLRHGLFKELRVYQRRGLLVYPNEVMLTSGNDIWILARDDFKKLLKVPLNAIIKKKTNGFKKK